MFKVASWVSDSINIRSRAMARMREGAEGEREVMGIDGEAYRLGRDFCAAGVRVNGKSQKEKGKERYT